jgi:adenine-specific DNA-methyltransferase
VGESGWLSLGLLTVESVTTEEFLVLAAQTDAGQPLDPEWCRRLLRLEATDAGGAEGPPEVTDLVDAEIRRCLNEVEIRNGRYLDAEVTKLDRWSDDIKLGLERELKDLDAAIRDARRQSAVAVTLAGKLTAQREIKALEQKRNHKRLDLFEAQDQIDAQRAELIVGIERQLAATHRHEPLFRVRWSLR